jgi:DNA processing protein
LIRDGARLVESASEVAETLVPAARALGAELALRLERSTAGTSAEPIRQSGGWRDDPQYQRLMDVLGHDPIALDELSAQTGQSAGELSSMLLMLELEGCVEGLPGGRYQRLPGI